MAEGDLHVTLSGEDDLSDALVGAFEGLEKIAHVMAQVAEEGDKVSDATAAFKGELLSLREATRGEVDDLQLMQAANAATAKGLDATAGQTARLAEIAKTFSESTGEDWRGTFERITQAVIRGGRAAKSFGVDVEGLNTRGERLAAVLEQAGARAATMRNRVETAGDSITRMEVSMRNANLQFSKGFSESTKLAQALEKLNQTIRGGSRDAELYGGSLGDMAASGVNAVNKIILGMQAFRRELRDVRVALGIQSATAGQNLTGINDRRRPGYSGPAIEGTGGSLGSGPVGMGDYSAAGDAAILAARRAQYASAGTTPRRGGGGGGRAASQPRSLDDLMSGATGTTPVEDMRNLEAEMTSTLDQGAQERERIREREAQAAKRTREKDAADAKRAADKQKRIDEQRITAMRQTAIGVGQVAQLGAQLLGAGEAEMLVIKGLSEAAMSAVEFAALNPLGGVAHALASALAFKGASEVGAKSGGGASRGAGAVAGAASAPRLGAPRDSGGGGGGITIVQNIRNSTSSDYAWQDDLTKALVSRFRRTGQAVPIATKNS